MGPLNYNFLIKDIKFPFHQDNYDFKCKIQFKIIWKMPTVSKNKTKASTYVPVSVFIFRAFYDMRLHFLSHSFIYYSGSFDAPQPAALSHTSQHTGDSAATCRTPQVGTIPDTHFQNVVGESLYLKHREKTNHTITPLFLHWLQADLFKEALNSKPVSPPSGWTRR